MQITKRKMFKIDIYIFWKQIGSMMLIGILNHKKPSNFFSLIFAFFAVI